MRDEQCVRFLQWALPQLHMRWPGFRKVRGQVCKRVQRRIRELGLASVEDYCAWLQDHAEEWVHLDALCRITISRFYRDKGVFDVLAAQVLPALAEDTRLRGERLLRIWSAGCGSGEEPYTLALIWHHELRTRFSDIAIDIIATDADPNVLHRAREARYACGSLKELPADWRRRSFSVDDDTYCLEPEYRHGVRFMQQDIREQQAEGPFDLVLCRNLVFTYFDKARQSALQQRIVDTMRAGAALVLGAHEQLVGTELGLTAWFEQQAIYRRVGSR